jgi:hypothetical protein
MFSQPFSINYSYIRELKCFNHYSYNGLNIGTMHVEVHSLGFAEKGVHSYTGEWKRGLRAGAERSQEALHLIRGGGREHSLLKLKVFRKVKHNLYYVTYKNYVPSTSVNLSMVSRIPNTPLHGVWLVNKLIRRPRTVPTKYTMVEVQVVCWLIIWARLISTSVGSNGCKCRLAYKLWAVR